MRCPAFSHPESVHRLNAQREISIGSCPIEFISVREAWRETRHEYVRLTANSK
jgi:hypothetical protein